MHLYIYIKWNETNLEMHWRARVRQRIQCNISDRCLCGKSIFLIRLLYRLKWSLKLCEFFFTQIAQLNSKICINVEEKSLTLPKIIDEMDWNFEFQSLNFLNNSGSAATVAAVCVKWKSIYKKAIRQSTCCIYFNHLHRFNAIIQSI